MSILTVLNQFINYCKHRILYYTYNGILLLIPKILHINAIAIKLTTNYFIFNFRWKTYTWMFCIQ